MIRNWIDSVWSILSTAMELVNYLNVLHSSFLVSRRFLNSKFFDFTVSFDFYIKTQLTHCDKFNLWKHVYWWNLNERIYQTIIWHPMLFFSRSSSLKIQHWINIIYSLTKLDMFTLTSFWALYLTKVDSSVNLWYQKIWVSSQFICCLNILFNSCEIRARVNQVYVFSMHISCIHLWCI